MAATSATAAAATAAAATLTCRVRLASCLPATDRLIVVCCAAPARRLCVKHVKSNAITVAKDGKLLGMGSGQPNRVKSVQIALEKAKEEVKVRQSCCQ